MVELTQAQIDRFASGLARILHAVADYWETKAKLLEPPEETPHAEVFKRGEKPAPAETKEQYRDMPAEGPGRFSDLVRNSKT
jgi:hypothetical protein